MIIKEAIQILDSTQYRLHSDSGFYLKNKNNDAMWVEVNTIAPDDFEETDIVIVVNKYLELLEKGLITQDEYDILTKTQRSSVISIVR